MSLADDIRRAYDGTGEAWNEGPAVVYRALAEPVLEVAGAVAGLQVLDVGSGSGALADELARRGARVLALDLSLGMLRQGARGRPPAAVADVRALPVRRGCADLVTASFVLNHVDDPVAGFREMGRALRHGGRVLATTFAGEGRHPAKRVLDEVAVRHGFAAPAWYASVKSGLMPLLSSPARFADAAREAGLREVQVTHVPVSLHLTPARLVAWRFGMPHLAPFVAGLPGQARRAMVREAEGAVEGITQPVLMGVLVLQGTA